MRSRRTSQAGTARYSADDETIITAGVSEGLDIAIRAIVNPGDEGLIAEPSYVSYAPCVTLAGGIPFRWNAPKRTISG